MKKMINALAKFFSYGCLHCGSCVKSKKIILCPLCEYQMKYYDPIPSPHIISAVTYSNAQSRTLIHYMKDNYDPYVFHYAAKLIKNKFDELGITESLEDFSITYAPRNPLNLLKMRFDHAKEIADFLSFELFGNDSQKLLSLFDRYPFADEQKTLNLKKRRENALQIFSLKENVTVPKRVIIVDDVTTTGSTLFALRDLLFKAGTKDCILCTVAVNDNHPTYF